MSLKIKISMPDKYVRMIEDDSFFDVTVQEVRIVLRRMKMMKHVYSEEDIIKFRIKYDLWIDDAEKRFMVKRGLDYKNNHISHNPQTLKYPSYEYIYSYSQSFYVDGFTEKQWDMLTDSSYIPKRISLISHFIEQAGEAGDKGIVELLLDKYGYILDNTREILMKKYHIPANANFKEVTCAGIIDGIPFNLWRMLYDDDYLPPVQILRSTITRLRNSNDDKKFTYAEQVEKKYFDFLYPDYIPPATQEEIDEANEYFNSICSVRKQDKDT